jgi:hypothetical protein
LVSNGSLKFYAYALDGKKYKVSNRVYVTIPNGDYSSQKIIMGTYSADTETDYLYTNPFEYLLSAASFDIITKENKLSLSNINEINTPVFTIKKIDNNVELLSSALGNFNYIGLEVAFETGMGGESGEFQVIIDLLDKNQ